MNIYGRLSAALGSLALNGVLALVLAQEAGAATPAANGSVQSPQSYTVYVGDEQHQLHERCTSGIQSRAILAVLLALIV